MKCFGNFDDDRVDLIYSEAFYTPRMGQAIMNRLLKAAGHKDYSSGGVKGQKKYK